MEPKILILFGAGASHGAGGLNAIPPLGITLFEELSERYPNTWGKLPPQTNELFQKNFEFGMEQIYSKLDNMNDLLKDMAKYFSKFNIIDPYSNLYFKLIECYLQPIRSDELLLSTINYDCLIELAALLLNPSITHWVKNEVGC